jgi:arylamine N-acetyltransferase
MQIGAARMAVEQFDIDAWFSRIGYDGSRDPTLGNLKLLVTAHATAIAYESIDVLLNKPPSLDPKLLQSKMIFGGRGGYCFEQNMLFRAGLLSLGYTGWSSSPVSTPSTRFAIGSPQLIQRAHISTT